VTIGEFVRFRGIRLAAVLDGSRGSFRDNWSGGGEDEESVMLPRRFGERFGMSVNRFRTLDRAYRFGPNATAQQRQVRGTGIVCARKSCLIVNCSTCMPLILDAG